MSERMQSVGVFAALGAFGIWGLVPAYFKLLGHVDAGSIIAHRVVWTLLLVSAWMLLRGRIDRIIAIARQPRVVGALLASALLVALNWLLFVWAVNHDRVLATSLGYFINPLVNVLLGMLFLGERLTRRGWTAVGLAAAGTTLLGVHLGEPPWIALLIAVSFGSYGLIRKLLGTDPMAGLWWEALWLTLPSLAWLHHVEGVTFAIFAPYDTATDWLLVGAGVLTLVPLVLFALAANHLRLTTVGFFQYLAPTLSFTLAVAVYDEPFDSVQAIAFGLIWTGLLIFAVRPRRSRRSPQAAAR